MICDSNEFKDLFFPKTSKKIIFNNHIKDYYLLENLSIQEQIDFIKNTHNGFKSLKNIQNPINKETSIIELEEKALIIDAIKN